ncbi:MAG TPA: type VI secretion system baseplate subunit TssK [Steroidobacteraceae bacterium]|nr:type VI secretion system baseplate subunit TssK [Steroidobacteraceae bacterium]
MSSRNRVVWSEGLFLRPQHFQQQVRYLERYVEGRARELRAHSWGFTELELQSDLLAIGKLGLRRAAGVFPDGTPFSMPDDDPLPAPLELTPQVRDQRVYLAVALRKEGAREADRRDAVDGLLRYKSQDFETRDITSESSAAATLEVAALRARLLLGSESREDFACIPLAHIRECRADRVVTLEGAFIPTVLNAHKAERLATFMTELQGLLHQRGEALAARAVASGRGGAAEIADFLLLQTVNRYEPVVDHCVSNGFIHPEELFRLCLEVEGDLSTLTTNARRPPKLPGYQHEDLRASYDPLITALRTALSVVLEQHVVPIPLEKKGYNISVGVVHDKSLFDTAAFVLAARADVPGETLRRGFPAQATIATVESIRNKVNEHLPGVPLQPLAVVPRQIQYHAGFVYFELERSDARFRELKGGGGIAIHVPESFPGLAMELWAIRG